MSRTITFQSNSNLLLSSQIFRRAVIEELDLDDRSLEAPLTDAEWTDTLFTTRSLLGRFKEVTITKDYNGDLKFVNGERKDVPFTEMGSTVDFDTVRRQVITSRRQQSLRQRALRA